MFILIVRISGKQYPQEVIRSFYDFLPSSEVVYGIHRMIDYRGSWINDML